MVNRYSWVISASRICVSQVEGCRCRQFTEGNDAVAVFQQPVREPSIDDGMLDAPLVYRGAHVVIQVADLVVSLNYIAQCGAKNDHQYYAANYEIHLQPLLIS